MNKTVLVIGGATTDTIITYEDMETLVHQSHGAEQSYLLLEEGKKIEVIHQQVSSGGGATNTAVSFKRQGYDVNLFCKIGEDAAGQLILDELQKFDIDTHLIVRSKEHGTASSFIIPSLKGDRVVFAYRGANATLSMEDLSTTAIAAANFMYITSLSRESASHIPDIVKIAKEHEIPIAINPGVSQLKLGADYLTEALSGIDILISNLSEAETLMHSLKKDKTDGIQDNTDLLAINVKFEDSRFNLREFFETILTIGPRIVVVTHGSEGVYVANRKHIYYHPAPSTEKLVNTLGAGDAFGAAFVGAIYGGKTIPDAIRHGIANSESVIGYSDAKTGLLDKASLEKSAGEISTDLCVEKSW